VVVRSCGGGWLRPVLVSDRTSTGHQ